VAEVAEKEKTQQTNETFFESFASYCAMFAIVIFAWTFVFQNYMVPSGSMLKTILIGDHLFVDRLTFGEKTAWAPFVHHRDVQRGDIIVFRKPVYQPGIDATDADGTPQYTTLVKRVIGVPGDHIRLQDGVVYLNGKPQVEPLATKPDSFEPYRDDFPNVPVPDGIGVAALWSVDLPSHIQNGDLVVPPGEYFAMGDNRPNSLDSRFWGFVPRENILGRPLFVYWSYDMPEQQDEITGLGPRLADLLHTAATFFQKTRWSRTFHRIV
jgi:signal peptidase I